MPDPYASDPHCLELDRRERIARAANWNDARARYRQGVITDAPIPPCAECGASEIAHDGLNWCCAECGALRFVVHIR